MLMQGSVWEEHSAEGADGRSRMPRPSSSALHWLAPPKQWHRRKDTVKSCVDSDFMRLVLIPYCGDQCCQPDGIYSLLRGGLVRRLS